MPTACRPRLSLYIARTFALQIVLVLAGLLVLVLTVDVLGESNAILAQAADGGGALTRYLLLRLPVMASQFAPFAVLLAALTTVATLAYTGQVVAMKSSGLSTGQIVAPMAAVGGVCAFLHFALNETVTAGAAARLADWQAAGYGALPSARAPRTRDLWVEEAATVVHAGVATPDGDTLVLTDVTLFHYGPDGALDGVTHAARGRLSDSMGELENVEEFDMTANVTMRRDRQPWPLDVTPEDFFQGPVNPDHVGALALSRSVAGLAARGRPVTPLVADLHHKLAWPAACIMMPLFAGIAASSLTRTGSVLLRSGGALLFGFAYFIADSLALAMARTGALPPAAAPWLVLALFFLLGQTALLRVNR